MSWSSLRAHKNSPSVAIATEATTWVIHHSHSSGNSSWYSIVINVCKKYSVKVKSTHFLLRSTMKLSKYAPATAHSSVLNVSIHPEMLVKSMYWLVKNRSKLTGLLNKMWLKPHNVPIVK